MNTLRPTAKLSKKAAQKAAFFASLPPQTVVVGELRKFLLIDVLADVGNFYHLTYNTAKKRWTNHPKLHLAERKGKRWVAASDRIFKEQKNATLAQKLATLAQNVGTHGYKGEEWTAIPEQDDTVIVIDTQLHIDNKVAYSLMTSSMVKSMPTTISTSAERWVIVLYNEKHYYMPEEFFLKVTEVIA
ncbi:MAG: hypothetical protein WC761_00305 [Candidatus Paceibacterota bacterium]|jgi:hypothetical protein